MVQHVAQRPYFLSLHRDNVTNIKKRPQMYWPTFYQILNFCSKNSFWPNFKSKLQREIMISSKKKDLFLKITDNISDTR